MRNPARKALYCLIATLAGAALIWFGAERHGRIGDHWTTAVPIALGFTVGPIGFFFLVQALFAVRGRALLLAGHKVIARWHLYPAEWEQFRKLDARRSGERFSLANDLWVRKSTPAGGVDVIVGEKSILVDHSYHVLRPGGLPELREVRWLDGPPSCLEFALRYPRGRYGGTVTFTLRVPVPPGSRGPAQKVFDHFDRLTRRTPGIALRNPRSTYRVCAMAAAAAVAAIGIGYAVVRGAGPLLPMVLQVGGTILVVFAAIVALATFLLTRKA